MLRPLAGANGGREPTRDAPAPADREKSSPRAAGGGVAKEGLHTSSFRSKKIAVWRPQFFRNFCPKVRAPARGPSFLVTVSQAAFFRLAHGTRTSRVRKMFSDDELSRAPSRARARDCRTAAPRRAALRAPQASGLDRPATFETFLLSPQPGNLRNFRKLYEEQQWRRCRRGCACS